MTDDEMANMSQNPNTAVHTMYVAVCHVCDWESVPYVNWRAADLDADQHVCETK